MKKKTPVELWQRIEPLLNEFKNYYKTDNSYNQALRLVDNDINSDFFFEFGFQTEDQAYPVKLKPQSQSVIRDYSISVNSGDLEKYLSSWLNVLKYYSDVRTPYDDPIETFFFNEYYSKIRLEGDDADSNPLDDEKLYKLDEYLNSVRKILGEFKSNAGDAQKASYEKIEQDCDRLKEKIQLLTKNEALQGVASLWAKAKKLSLSLAKDLIVEFLKDGLKSITSMALKLGSGDFSYFEQLSN